jgi:NADP-dependent 3-hydroxy acid dehydrogenase YdfG
VQAAVRAATEQLAIPASAVADAIGYAVGQPDNVDVNELIVRSPLKADHAASNFAYLACTSHSV